MTLDKIIDLYIRDYRKEAAREMRAFEIQRSLTAAIRQAALCRLPSGRRHSHQRRIPQAVLEDAEQRLQKIAKKLARVADFGALHCIIDSEISPIRGIGPLIVYDVSHRVGAFLGKAPALVYLHCGTKAGAAILGFRGKTVDPKVLPPAFSRLTAAEIEDCLCIYKAQLAGTDFRTRLSQRPSHCFDAKPRVSHKC